MRVEKTHTQVIPPNELVCVMCCSNKSFAWEILQHSTTLLFRQMVAAVKIPLRETHRKRINFFFFPLFSLSTFRYVSFHSLNAVFHHLQKGVVVRRFFNSVSVCQGILIAVSIRKSASARRQMNSTFYVGISITEFTLERNKLSLWCISKVFRLKSSFFPPLS